MKILLKNKILQLKNWPWLLFFSLLAIGQLQRIQLTNNLAFYLHDVLILIWLAYDLILSGRAQKNRAQLLESLSSIFKNKLLLSIVFFALLSTLSGFLGGRIDLVSLLYLSRLIIYIAFISWLKITPDQPSFPKISAFAGVGLLIAFFGFLQYIFLPDVRFLHIWGWDNHYYRLISTIFDPGFTGMILVLGLASLFLANKNNSWKKPAPLLASLLIVTAIAFTFSRSSYLALATLLGLLVLKFPKKKFFLFGLGLFFLALLPLLPKPGGAGVNLGRTETLMFRFSNSQQGLDALQSTDQWLWGRGVFNTDSQKESFTNNHSQVPDNLFVTLLNNLGIIGTGLIVVVFGKYLYKAWQKNPIWSAALVATLVHSMFNNTMLQPFVFLTLWGMWASTTNNGN